jgi:hypothetical protein
MTQVILYPEYRTGQTMIATGFAEAARCTVTEGEMQSL